jgi:hypothetical protein
MNTKVIAGLGLAALAAYLLLRKKKVAPAAAAPAAIAPQQKPAEKRVFVDDAPSPVEAIEPVLEPSRPIEQVIEEKRLIALQAEETPIPSVEPVPSNPAVVFGGSSFYDSDFTQQMQDVSFKDSSFYSNQLVNTSQNLDIMR